MIPTHETFGGTWPFAPHIFDGNGFRMHYVDEGAGDPIICLHGELTWGYLYRRFIPPLSETHRVIVPDHMGFGKSETPQKREYTLKTHVDNLTNLIEALDLKNITLVMQDWGGGIGSAFTLRHPDRVKRLLMFNTLAGYGNAELDFETPWFQFIRKHHEAGTLRDVLGHLDANILSIMKLVGFENLAAVNEDWLKAYAAPFPTMEDCLGAIEFPLDALLGRFVPYVVEGFQLLDHLKAKPAMLAIGMKDGAISPAVQIADFKGIWPDRPIVKLPNVGHFCQEDAPETLIALIQLFMQSA
jgi:pimeloyl-ACP methyl ester carboxylesterase